MEIVALMNSSQAKINAVMDNDRSFPKPMITQGHFECKVRYWYENDILDYFKLNPLSKGRTRKKQSSSESYFKILSRFVDRTRPKIEHGSMISKQQCKRSSLKLSEQDGEFKERFDYNYQKTMK